MCNPPCNWMQLDIIQHSWSPLPGQEVQHNAINIFCLCSSPHSRNQSSCTCSKLGPHQRIILPMAFLAHFSYLFMVLSVGRKAQLGQQSVDWILPARGWHGPQLTFTRKIWLTVLCVHTNGQKYFSNWHDLPRFYMSWHVLTCLHSVHTVIINSPSANIPASHRHRANITVVWALRGWSPRVVLVADMGPKVLPEKLQKSAFRPKHAQAIARFCQICSMLWLIIDCLSNVQMKATQCSVAVSWTQLIYIYSNCM